MKEWCAVVAIVLLSGCGESDPVLAPSTMTVHAGESIQAAIDAAPANTTIFVEPGTYKEPTNGPSAVVISKDGLQLIGLSTATQAVVLENSGSQQNGIVVAPADSVSISGGEYPGEHPPCGLNGNLVHGFVLKGFTVSNFNQFGVYLACVDKFTLDQNVADSDQVYGLFPVRSHNGIMSNNEAQNVAVEAALYVGQSDHVTISGNTMHNNLLGLEIENCSDVTASGNQVFNNTQGILVDVQPGFQKTDQTNVQVVNNTVHTNNRSSPSTSTLPGIGIELLGGSMITVQGNTVTNNFFAGISVTSYCLGSPCTGLDIDPNPEHVRIIDNTLSGNGTHPDPTEVSLAADLVWDKSGMDNCWSGNTPTATTKIVGGSHLTLPVCG